MTLSEETKRGKRKSLSFSIKYMSNILPNASCLPCFLDKSIYGSRLMCTVVCPSAFNMSNLHENVYVAKVFKCHYDKQEY